jgi:hypothetical protein
MASERPDALWVHLVAFPFRARLLEFAATHRLPTVAQSSAWPQSGGLMSYGPDPADLFRRGAAQAAKILKGTKPADLPVEQPTKFELVINLKTARALGLTIPQSVLVRADEIISEQRMMDRRVLITMVAGACSLRRSPPRGNKKRTEPAWNRYRPYRPPAHGSIGRRMLCEYPFLDSEYRTAQRSIRRAGLHGFALI